MQTNKFYCLTILFFVFALTCGASIKNTLPPDVQRDVAKITKKTVEQYTKEGWRVMPGDKVAFEDQVEQIVIYRYFLSDRFIGVEGNGVDSDMELARQIASTQAFVQLAELLNARVESETLQIMKTREMSDEEAHNFTSLVLSSIIESEESFASSVLEFTFRRTDKHGKSEIQSFIFYDLNDLLSRLGQK